ncbi:hypothetical protein TrRE_jg12051, partial [Triparma retinervis]
MEESYKATKSAIGGPSSELEKVHASTLAQYDTACLGAVKAAKSLIQSALPEMLTESGYSSFATKETFLNHVGKRFDDETKGWKGSGNNKGVESTKISARKACLKKAGVAFDKAKVRVERGGKAAQPTGMDVVTATAGGKKKKRKK